MARFALILLVLVMLVAAEVVFVVNSYADGGFYDSR